MAAFEQLPWLQITPSNFLEAAVQGSHDSLQRRAQDLENAQAAARNAVSLAQIQAERDKSMAESASQDEYNKARLNQGEQRIGIGQQNADSHTQNADTHSSMADLAVEKFKTATDQKLETAATHAKAIKDVQSGKNLSDIEGLGDLPPPEAASVISAWKTLHPKVTPDLTKSQRYGLLLNSSKVLSIPGAETNYPDYYNSAKTIHDNLLIPDVSTNQSPGISSPKLMSPADSLDDESTTNDAPKFSYVRDKSGNLVLQ